MDEKKLDEMMKDMAEELAGEDMGERELERRIKRRLRAIVMRTLLTIFAAFLGLLLIVSPVIRLFCYNPMKKQKTMVDLEDGQISELELYLRTYASMFMPYSRIHGVSVKNKGFGIYEVTLDAPEPPGPYYAYDGPSENDVVYEVRWGYWYWKQNGRRMYRMMGRFEEPHIETVDEIREELSELPESSILYCTLLLPEAVLPETLARDGIEVLWIRVEHGAERGQEVGMSLECYTWPQKDRRQMTGAELKEEFLAELTILLSDPAFLESWGINGAVYGDPAGALQEVRDAAAELDAVRTSGICVSGKKEDILAYINEVGAVGVGVDYVRTSRWAQ